MHKMYISKIVGLCEKVQGRGVRIIGHSDTIHHVVTGCGHRNSEVCNNSATPARFQAGPSPGIAGNRR